MTKRFDEQVALESYRATLALGRLAIMLVFAANAAALLAHGGGLWPALGMAAASASAGAGYFAQSDATLGRDGRAAVLQIGSIACAALSGLLFLVAI